MTSPISKHHRTAAKNCRLRLQSTMRGFTACVAFLCGAWAGPTVSAQTQVSDYRPGVTPEGAVYCLPKTALRITVRVEKTTYTPGDFCKYANRYMRLEGVSEEPKTTHRLLSAKVSSYGVADPSKMYAVKFDPRTSASNIVLSDDGVLLAINSTPSPAVPAPKPFQPARKAERPNPRKYMNKDILAAGSTAKMAELTAQEIYDVRDSKAALVKGEADFMPKDGEQLKVMLANLQHQDDVLTSLFSGTVERDTMETTFTLCPEGEMNRTVLFRLSNKLGIVDADDMAGAPYYISVTDLKSLPQEDLDEKQLKAKEKREIAAREKGNCVYVNVPGKMAVTLYAGTKEIDSYEVKAAQMGKVEILSGDLFNKRYTTHLTLNPETGGVEKLDADMPK